MIYTRNMKNILYILDNRSDIAGFIDYLKRNKKTSDVNFHICPLTATEDKAINAERTLSVYGKTEIIPFLEEFHKNAFLVREKFISFISYFGRGTGGHAVSFIRYFRHPFRDFSLWWLSLIREKCTYKHQSYHDLIRLITIMNISERCLADEIYVDIRNGALKRAILKNKTTAKVIFESFPKKIGILPVIISLVKTFGYMAFFAARKFLLFIFEGGNAGRKKEILKRSEFVFVAPFPFADPNKASKNIFRNEYVGALHESAEKKHKNKVSFIGILHDNTRLNLREIKFLSRINSWGYCAFLPEELISLRQVVSSAFVFFLTFLKYILKIPYISSNFIFEYGNKKFNIWDLFEDEWRYSFAGSNLAKNLFYYCAFYNAEKIINSSAAIIYPFELYGWENALNIALRDNKRLKTVAVQNTSVPMLILNYFNTSEEFKGGNLIESLPMPDFIAASGRLPLRLLSDSGWPEERLFDLGATRYQKLSGVIERDIPWAARKKQVVVVLSSIEIEAREMLSFLLEAVKNEGTCDFIIKSHLLCDIKNTPGSMLIFDSKTPLHELFTLSRVAVVAGSAASIDAIACKCPVLIPRLYCMVDLNPLSGIGSGLPRYTTGKKEFLTTVRSMVNSEVCQIEPKLCTSFAKDYFTILKDEDSYFTRLCEKLKENTQCTIMDRRKKI